MSNWKHIVKIRSNKHPGDIFIKGSSWICKVYAHKNGNENVEEADVIIEAIKKHRELESKNNEVLK